MGRWPGHLRGWGDDAQRGVQVQDVLGVVPSAQRPRSSGKARVPRLSPLWGSQHLPHRRLSVVGMDQRRSRVPWAAKVSGVERLGDVPHATLFAARPNLGHRCGEEDIAARAFGDASGPSSPKRKSKTSPSKSVDTPPVVAGGFVGDVGQKADATSLEPRSVV